jgi:hypothetical protein
MAEYRITAPDGTEIVLEGPADATPDQIAQAAAAAFAQKQSQPGMLQEVGRQIGLTGRHAIEGAANTVGVLTDPLTNVLSAATGRNLSTAGQLGSQAADSLGLPMPREGLEQTIGAASRGVAGAAPLVGAGAALSQAASPVTRAVGQSMAVQPGAQAVAGAGGAGAADIVRQSDGGTGAQIAAALAGGIAAPMAVGGAQRLVQAARAPMAPPQVVQDAARVNVPVMTSDVLPPTTFVGRTAQFMGEKIPVAGTGGQRATQQAARVEAVKSFARDVGENLDVVPDQIIARSLRAGKSSEIAKYSDLKKGVFQKLDSAGPVPVGNVTQHIDDEIAQLNQISPSSFAPLTKKLDNFKTDIQGKSITQIEALRKQLGEELATDAFSSVKTQADKVNRSVYGALKGDMEQFIKNNGDARDVTKWKVADKRLSTGIGELKSSAFKAALDKGDVTPEAAVSMLFGKPSDTRLLYKTLTPEGRSAARTAIIQDVIKKSGGMDDLSPQRFVNRLRDLEKQTGIVFTQEQKQQADGLIRVIRATQRAGEASATPPTGVQGVPFVAGSFLGQAFGAVGSVATAGTIGVAARVYESVPVRNALIKLSQTKPGTFSEDAIIRRVIPALTQIEEQP